MKKKMKFSASGMTLLSFLAHIQEIVFFSVQLDCKIEEIFLNNLDDLCYSHIQVLYNTEKTGKMLIVLIVFHVTVAVTSPFLTKQFRTKCTCTIVHIM